MAKLNGRIALITGAGRGIGAATARRLVGDGARVVLADLDGESVRYLAAEIGTDAAVAVQADVTQGPARERMLDAAYRRWGRLDVLFNNAGIVKVAPLLDVQEADWDRLMDVNLKAVFFLLQAAARRMVRQEPLAGSELRGKLIQTASIAGFRGGNPMFPPYSISKSAVINLTRNAAQALAPRKVTSNCICPGAVDTAMWAQIAAEWGEAEGRDPTEVWQTRIAPIPLGRAEKPEDVANVVAFLAGPDSDYMTGQAVIVDGGLVMGS